MKIKTLLQHIRNTETPNDRWIAASNARLMYHRECNLRRNGRVFEERVSGEQWSIEREFKTINAAKRRGRKLRDSGTKHYVVGKVLRCSN